VRDAAFSPDGKTVLTWGDDGTARLWSAADGTPRGRPVRYGGRVLAAAFGPDGQRVLTISVDDGMARLWPVPRPIEGDPRRVELWVQVITGLELDEKDAVRVLDVSTWRDRKLQLDALGGPPNP
jgi:WD40 repeat protein